MIRAMPRQERVARGIYVQTLRDHYRVRVRHPRYDEGRERYPFKSHDRAQCEAFAQALAAKLEAASEERTMGDVLAAFERQHVRTLRRTTEEQWTRDIKLHLRPFWRDVPVAAVTRERLFDFGEAKLSDGASPHVLRRCYTILSAAVRWYWTEHPELELRCPGPDVALAWKRLRLRHHLELGRGAAWQPEEARALLEEAAKSRSRLYPVLRIAFGTGLRLGEILGLQWADVDWDRGRLHVRRTVDSRGRVAAVKSGRERWADASPGVMALLKQLRRRPRALWIFATRDGGPLLRKGLYDAMRGAKARLREKGLDPAGKSIHSARHTFVSLGIAAGQDEAWLAGQAGHHSAAYTRAAYGHEIARQRDLSWADEAADPRTTWSVVRRGTDRVTGPGKGPAGGSES